MNSYQENGRACTADVTVTLTLNPELFKKDILHQFNAVQGPLLVLSQNHKCTMVWELTTAGNMHFHAIFSFTKSMGQPKTPRGILRKFVKAHESLFGYFYIKPCTNYMGWCAYLKKGDKTAKNIMADDYDIFANPSTELNLSDEENHIDRHKYLFPDSVPEVTEPIGSR